MAGEIIKAPAVVLFIRPWSRTSHVVTWLARGYGVVSTLVKGAVRPKSAFLGQYDLFYGCELLWYARARGELHAIREAMPYKLREGIRGRWRETSLAAYACELVRKLAPAGEESVEWYDWLSSVLDGLAQGGEADLKALVSIEMRLLELAGLAPDFSGVDMDISYTPFSLDAGKAGGGLRNVRLTPDVVRALRGESTVSADVLWDAVRFLGLFLAFHLDEPPEVRRGLVSLLKH